VPKIKIYLREGETKQAAIEGLQKALDLHSPENNHRKEDFNDPAMDSTLEFLETEHDKMYSSLVEEVVALIRSEHNQ